MGRSKIIVAKMLAAVASAFTCWRFGPADLGCSYVYVGFFRRGFLEIRVCAGREVLLCRV